MKGRYNILFIILAVATLFTTGCHRRPLDMDYVDKAELTIILDWSKAQIDPNGATIIFYPADGSSPITKLTNQDTTTVSLDIGFYSIIAFNETFRDFDNISFRNTDYFETIEAYVKEEGANKAGDVISANPDILASVSVGEYQVTADMIEQTRSKTKTKTKTKTKADADALIDAYPNLVITLQPLRVVYPAVVTAKIIGLERISSAGAYVVGFSEGVFLSTGKTSIYSTTQKFTFTERTFNEGSSTEGYLRGNFNCFGLRYRDEGTPITGYTLSFRSILIDGSDFIEDRDISNKIRQIELEIGLEILVDLGDTGVGGDDPYVIPDVKGEGGWDVKVDEWEEVIVPIEF